MRQVDLKKWDNTVIKCESPEHGKKIIEFWKSVGVNTGFTGRAVGNCYGFIDERFGCYGVHQLINAKIITIPQPTEVDLSKVKRITVDENGVYSVEMVIPSLSYINAVEWGSRNSLGYIARLSLLIDKILLLAKYANSLGDEKTGNWVIYKYDGQICIISHTNSFYHFNTKELAEQVYNDNKELFDEYFELISK